jgi:hypothetical protein
MCCEAKAENDVIAFLCKTMDLLMEISTFRSGTINGIAFACLFPVGTDAETCINPATLSRLMQRATVDIYCSEMETTKKV